VIKAYDCDSHVQEGEQTFLDKYWDQRYRGRRPTVVVGDTTGSLSMLIDSRAHQRITGSGLSLSGSPMSKDGVPSPIFAAQIGAAEATGHIDTLESAEFHTAQARVEQLDRESIGVQVNFPSVLLTWPAAHDPKIGSALARAYNSWMADVSGQAPDRLKWVTAIDPADIEESVREIRRTREMGSVGLMLLGSVGHIHLDHPSLDPIWATLNELAMPAIIHPGFCNPGLDDQFDAMVDAVTIPFVFSQLLGFNAIMRSGLLDRYPNLRIAFVENGGCWVDYMCQRIAEYSLTFKGKTEQRTTQRPKPTMATVNEAAIGGSSLMRPISYFSEYLPEDYIRQGRIFVNCEVDEDQLPFVVERYGNDFLMFAGDIPHPHRVAHPIEKMLARTDLSEETKRKILVDNTAKFYGLPVPAPEPAPVSAGD
jgi:predicted TIM-barrel fold metal-dependent hydrolase